ncbi:MAG: tripartite tricarboxylate transporter substrate binding protein [Betaproteobacteria bacterium]|nr:tripartite tricarboxylate transporter substrate binding protein [Betaproteobacteria bacterium]
MKLRFAVLALIAASAPHQAATAQTYPNKPIRLVVPFSPGGGTDLQARTIGQHLSEAWGQPVIVDHRPGGTGAVGSNVVLQAAADGYTMIIVTSSTHAIAPNLYREAPYNPVRDFTGVAQTATAPEIIAAHPSLPVHTAKELIALAQKRPGKLNYASPGAGTIGHMTGELFKQVTHVNVVHVPYKGSGAAVRELLGGQVELMFSAPGALVEHVRAGRLRALGVLDNERTPLFEGLPTLAELGYPQLDASNWYGLLVKTGTPATIVQKLNEEVNRIMQQEKVKTMLFNQGYSVKTGTPEQFTKFVASEYEKWGKVVKQAGVKVD